MADRFFSAVILLVAIGYLYIAFTIIKAPFQYDPLGPETWPRILGMAAVPCCLYILAKPDVASFNTTLRTLIRLGILVLMLLAYAWMFEPLGYIVSTFVFCAALSMLLGARPLSAVIFGVLTGVVGYFVCTRLLELNLPAGVFKSVL